MRGISFNSAKQRVSRALVFAGVGLTLAVSAVPAQAAGKPVSPGGSHRHDSGGGGTGHKVG